MVKNISEKDILQVLSHVKHPAINCSLIELGIVKNIIAQNKKVIVTFAFPFVGIPIKESIAKLGAKVEVKETIMTDSERENFLKLEREHWTGGK